MNNTKIDWCDMTWNPVTGCYHGCEYCYARKIARRFGNGNNSGHGCHEVNQKKVRSYHEAAHHTGPYPYGFDPTLYNNRLIEPARNKKSKTIFVCSMADLFGDWVPDEWIQKVFAACAAAPQHRYLFLTKNPARYVELVEKGFVPDSDQYLLGTSVTSPTDPYFWRTSQQQKAHFVRTFLSVEPMLEDFGYGHEESERMPDWLIVGAEMGNRKGKIIPQKAWIDNLADWCKTWYIPIFMKESLRNLMGTDFLQEFPWDSNKTTP